MEPNIAKLASERISREDLTKLEKNIHETLSIVKSDLPSPSQNIEFHSLIAEATHNPVIALTMKTLFNVVKEMTLEMKANLPRRIEVSSHAVEFHNKILNALRKKIPKRSTT